MFYNLSNPVNAGAISPAQTRFEDQRVVETFADRTPTINLPSAAGGIFSQLAVIHIVAYTATVSKEVTKGDLIMSLQYQRAILRIPTN